MNRRIMAVALVVASAACSSTNKDVAIRSVNSEPAGGAQEALARGDLLFARGEHALALDGYRRAMRMDPVNGHALNGVAISYAAMGRHDLAREFFELALARAPQDERIYRNFARSLMAQGQKDEAQALLAQVGSGVAGMARSRPTLAQLTAQGAAMPASAPVRSASIGLERMSMGEVRLRTTGTQPALPGRMLSQLTTAIVTVADGGAQAPALPLTRELKAPIMTASVPLESAASVAAKASAAANAKPKAKAVAAAEPACVAGRAKSAGFRLPATGYSISLIGPKADTAVDCTSMAGGDEPDNRFEKLWKWSGRLG